MRNVVYLEAFSNSQEDEQSQNLKLSLESLITYCIYKYCAPEDIKLYVILSNEKSNENSLALNLQDVTCVEYKDIPWQAASCLFPVAIYEDTVITGLCAVARHICKYRRSEPIIHEHEEGLLGFRKSCLQAPNEVSIWTKFCEVDIIKTVHNLVRTMELNILPQHLVRFENHLKKPVRIHNVYKIARDIKKEQLQKTDEVEKINNDLNEKPKERVPKPRKWKSNTKKQQEIDSTTKIEDLDINHHFAEGPFLTLADLLLLPSYYICSQVFGLSTFFKYLPLTYKWYTNILNISELKIFTDVLTKLKIEPITVGNLILPETEDVSLYKSDPKRHNPKKRLFTKPEDIENALNSLCSDLELKVNMNEMDCGIPWDKIPEGANPSAGHLPDERVNRKSQQLENLALAVTAMAKDGDRIVDFCSGSGHLGILIAHLLPNCTIILLENKEQSLLRARSRVHEMGLNNVYFFQCNLDFFIGKFDIGVALHACGIASDLVLDKCLKANAKFVLCPCCYGSLHATDRLRYPRSNKFSCISIDHYLCIGHTADQTHKEHPLSNRGDRCMAIIDSDRGRLAEEHGYTVTLSRLKPLSCTPKNNLLIGVPSASKTIL